jgi:hypothetical protein
MKRSLLIPMMLVICPSAALSAEAATQTLSLTTDNIGYTAIAIFGIAYLLVMAEEFTHLRKSKPVILAAGLI